MVFKCLFKTKGKIVTSDKHHKINIRINTFLSRISAECKERNLKKYSNFQELNNPTLFRYYIFTRIINSEILIHTTFFFAGNSKPAHPHGHSHSTIKDLAGSILGDDKSKDDGELWSTVEAQTAFLGPNLWDKTYETDLKVSIEFKLISF